MQNNPSSKLVNKVLTNIDDFLGSCRLVWYAFNHS